MLSFTNKPFGLSVIMPNVIILNVIVLIVVALSRDLLLTFSTLNQDPKLLTFLFAVHKC